MRSPDCTIGSSSRAAAGRRQRRRRLCRRAAVGRPAPAPAAAPDARADARRRARADRQRSGAVVWSTLSLDTGRRPARSSVEVTAASNRRRAGRRPCAARRRAPRRRRSPRRCSGVRQAGLPRGRARRRDALRVFGFGDAVAVDAPADRPAPSDDAARLERATPRTCRARRRRPADASTRPSARSTSGGVWPAFTYVSSPVAMSNTE